MHVIRHDLRLNKSQQKGDHCAQAQVQLSLQETNGPLCLERPRISRAGFDTMWRLLGHTAMFLPRTPCFPSGACRWLCTSKKLTRKGNVLLQTRRSYVELLKDGDAR
uniref:Uncharacterized protein n=1 Tax=Cannabis sativa TaxID=3483 RepID=A0A803QQX4_CANSA